MGFLSTLMGIDQEDGSTTDEAFNVLEVINAHVQWKTHLENYLNGTSEEKFDPRVICRDDECKLGIWIHGPALKLFNADDVLFKTLCEDHAQFHAIACKVVENMQANNRAAAQALMQGEYSQISHKVVHDLTVLKKHLVG